MKIWKLILAGKFVKKFGGKSVFCGPSRRVQRGGRGGGWRGSQARCGDENIQSGHPGSNPSPGMLKLNYVHCVPGNKRMDQLLWSALQMKARWDFNANVWFPFTSCIPRNETVQPRCFQNRIIMFCFPISTFMYLWAIYIFPRSVSLFGCSHLGRPIRGINKSLTDTWMCRNWDWSRAKKFPILEIHKFNFRYSVFIFLLVLASLGNFNVSTIQFGWGAKTTENSISVPVLPREGVSRQRRATTAPPPRHQSSSPQGASTKKTYLIID